MIIITLQLSGGTRGEVACPRPRQASWQHHPSPPSHHQHHAPHHWVVQFRYKFLVGWLQNASQAEWCLVLGGVEEPILTTFL